MFRQNGLDDQDFHDSTICSEADVAAVDALVIDLYNSTESDGAFIDLFSPVIDSGYTEWDSEEEISETNFGTATPEIGEVSDEDECVRRIDGAGNDWQMLLVIFGCCRNESSPYQVTWKYTFGMYAQ